MGLREVPLFRPWMIIRLVRNFEKHTTTPHPHYPLGWIALPSYIKLHSMGEFIFDSAWAEAAYRADIEYYPKVGR